MALPRRGDFSIGSDLDFRVARLRRITWDAGMGAWYPIFTFDRTENPEQGADGNPH